MMIDDDDDDKQCSKVTASARRVEEPEVQRCHAGEPPSHIPTHIIFSVTASQCSNF